MQLGIQRARELVARFPDQRIVVVGDLMLDRYLYGRADRLSPEAPVPVVRVGREDRVPGGASNVARNIRAMGGRAAVCGVVGADAEGRDLLRILRRAGVETGGVEARRGRRTTVKMRVVAERQQCVRVDWEEPLAWTKAGGAAFAAAVAREVRRGTGAIIEDYAKGVVTQGAVDAVLRAARAARIPTSLDPKDNEDLRVRGVTVATPNRKEAFAGAGMKDPGPADDPLRDGRLLEAGERLLEKWGPRFLVITLGPLGMLLMARGRPPRHVPTRAREVFDVSGAGDTVIAVCTLALAAGADGMEAAELANFAAGVVVGKAGTATCSPEELLARMGE
jgi:D-beta-D-heptose 7-phosphate kinase/D-beta-D-heptose 1-phosphate adenosyltransferase